MEYRRVGLVLILITAVTMSCRLPDLLWRGVGEPGGVSEQLTSPEAGQGQTDSSQPTPQHPFSFVSEGYEFTAFAIIESPHSAGMKTLTVLFAQERLTDEQRDLSPEPFNTDVRHRLTTQEGYEYEGQAVIALWNERMPEVPVGVPHWAWSYRTPGTMSWEVHPTAARFSVAEGTSGYVLHLTSSSGEVSLPLEGLPVLRREHSTLMLDRFFPWEIAQEANAHSLIQATPSAPASFNVGDTVNLTAQSSGQEVDLEMTLVAAERQGDSAVITLQLRNSSGGYEANVPMAYVHLIEDGCLFSRTPPGLSLGEERTVGPNQEITSELELDIHSESNHVVVWLHHTETVYFPQEWDLVIVLE